MTFAGGAGDITGLAFIHGRFVESFGAVEGADASDHHEGALVVASSVVEYFVVGAAGAGGVGADTGGTVISAILAGSIDGIGANGAVIQTFEVEQIAAA